MTKRNQFRQGRPKAEDAEETSGKILAASADLFRREGYAKTSIEKIARECRVAKHTVYRRFSSKEEIFIAVMHSTALSLLDNEYHNLLADDDPVSHIENLCYKVFQASVDPVIVDMYRAAIAEASRLPQMTEMLRLQGMMDAVIPLSRHVQRAQEQNQVRDGDPVTLALNLLLGVISVVFVPALFGEQISREEQHLRQRFDEVWAMIAGGLLSAKQI